MDDLRYTDLIAAILNLALLVAVAVIARRHGQGRSQIVWGLLAFLLIRTLSRLNDSPDVFFRDDPRLELVFDVLSVVVMVYLLTQVGKLNRLVTAMMDEARFRGEEYERAKRHYTQVVRHRVFNPLTVIEGSAHTLKSELGANAEVRNELCDSVLAMARELREVTLEPERRDALEHDLDAIPNLKEDARATEYPDAGPRG